MACYCVGDIGGSILSDVIVYPKSTTLPSEENQVYSAASICYYIVGQKAM